MMVPDLREMGIEDLGEMPWGTHLCAFYESKDDLLELLLPYFEAGLRNDEFCMYIASESPDRERTEEGMRGRGLGRYLDKGQMQIIPREEWYLKGGIFDARRVLDGWLEKCEEAAAGGYDGVRVMGNIAWLDKVDWRSLAEYEARANRSFKGHRMIAVCSYPIDRCDERRTADLVATHQFELVRNPEEWAAIRPTQAQGAVGKVLELRDELDDLDALLIEGRLERAIAGMLRNLEDSFGGGSLWRRSLASCNANRDLCDEIRTWAQEQLEEVARERDEIQSLTGSLARMHRKMSGARYVRARAESGGVVMEVEGCRGFDGCETRTSRGQVFRCVPAMAVAAMLQHGADTPVWVEVAGDDRVCRIGLHPAWILECLKELEPFDLDGLVVLRGGNVLFSHVPSDSEAEALNEAVLFDEERPVETDVIRVEEFERGAKKVLMARLGESLISLCTSGDAPTERLRAHLARAITLMASF